MLKTSNEVYMNLVIERAGQDDFLKAYGPSQWDEARDVCWISNLSHWHKECVPD